MIADFAQVSLMDGTTKPAMDINAGGCVMTVRNNRMVPTEVVQKTVESHEDVVCLILSNGQKLIGSRDQLVSTYRGKNTWYTPMADIEAGMELRGKVSGVPVVVRVVGVMYHAKKQVRLVGIQCARNDCFVAEGVLCR